MGAKNSESISGLLLDEYIPNIIKSNIQLP